MESGKRDMTVYAPIDPGESMDAIGNRIQQHAQTRRSHPALIDEQGTLDWRSLVDQVNRIANRLREAGLRPGESVAALSGNSRDDVALYLGTLVAGGCMVPLSGMASSEALALMVADCQARFLFVSGQQRELFGRLRAQLTKVPGERIISLAGPLDGAGYSLVDWLAQTTATARPEPVTLDDPFNIIYSSGTTGTPKGILHDYRFRQRQMVRMSRYGLDGEAINLVSTPLYSNTTLVSVLPTLYHGGTLVLMAKFDAHRFLQLAETHRVTHAMLVPVQYQRILAQPDFDRFDLSSFKLKLCTSAPLRSAVIADAMARWPGNLRELQNRLRQALLLGESPQISAEDMGFIPNPNDNHDRNRELSLDAFRSRADRQAISVSLALAHNNVSAAARLLNISRVSFYRLMDKHHVPHGPSTRLQKDS